MKIACITPIDHIDGLMTLLKSFAKVFYLPNGTKDEVIELIRNKKCDVIYTNPNMQGFVIDKEILDLGIKTVCTASTGVNHIDGIHCLYKNIKVISLTTDYETINNIPATAEHAFALTMSLIRKVPSAFDHVKDGGWDYQKFVGRQLKDLKFGVVGYGRLGKMYVKYAEAFSDHRVRICDPYILEADTCDLNEIFAECDVVSLHVHLNDETIHMINKSVFNKPLYLINTSRGDIVNENDTLLALSEGKLLGYATDVLSDELLDVRDNFLVDISKTVDNILITPHIGGMTTESQHMAYTRVANVLKETKPGKGNRFLRLLSWLKWW